MACICEITGKRGLSGNTVSHANNKSRMKQYPNIQKRSFFIPELKVRFRVKVSNHGLRLLDKRGGLAQFVRSATMATLSPRLRRLRRSLEKHSA